MSADLIDEILTSTGITRRTLLEKDLLVHRILRRLSEDTRFSDSYLFKGGTCLIKCHLGYYRFSEDVDFTYRNQSEYEGLSMKETRRLRARTGFKPAGPGCTAPDSTRVNKTVSRGRSRYP